MSDLVDLKICGLTIPEVKELLVKMREIEQRNPERYFHMQVLGLQDKPLREVEEILKDIFPKAEGVDFFTATLKNRDKKVQE